jgi:hypothetical protein
VEFNATGLIEQTGWSALVVILATDDAICQIVALAETERFEQNQAELEAIVGSFREAKVN